jgi:hypothetical protein
MQMEEEPSHPWFQPEVFYTDDIPIIFISPAYDLNYVGITKKAANCILIYEGMPVK